MEEATFFKLYLPALEEALSTDGENYGFHVHGPDWYVEDEDLRAKMDLFEDENFERFPLLFQKVAHYFDAKSHSFERIGDTPSEEYKLQLLKLVDFYKSQYKIE